MVTEEELSQMTPEELAAFQKQNCVFCQIASGKVPAKAVYSDDESIAVLDIHPAEKGHMLLMPKEHYSVMPQLPEHLAEHLFMVCKGLSQAALKSLRCKGTTIFIANGIAAGQKAPHFMIHIIPRNDGDGLALGIPERNIPKKELDAVNAALRKVLGMSEMRSISEHAQNASRSDMKERMMKAEVVKEEKRNDDSGKKSKKKTAQKKKSGGRFDLDSVTRMLTK